MARKRTHTPLNVYLNARFVGQLRREATGAIEFQYAPAWLEWEHCFAVSISLPLREERYVGDQVIAVFDNLLPDNDELRRRVADRSQATGTDAYSLLSAIGRDCVGALQFLPKGDEPGKAGELNSEAVSASRIAEILSGLPVAPLGIGEDESFRISLAGVQDKTALLYMNENWHIPHGTTATTHILKPQIGRRSGVDLSQSVENEYLCMQILGALELPVATTRIEDFDNQRALVVERFDRRWTRDGRLFRLPQEDCCQALSVPPALKYEEQGGPGILDVLEFMKGSDEPQKERILFMKAQIVFWLMAATDGHAKNFSVFLHPSGGFALTPFYDVLSSQPLYDTGQLRRNQFRLAMSVGRNRHYHVYDILPRHFIQSGSRAGMSETLITQIMEELNAQLPDAMDMASETLPADFPEQLRESIVEGINRRLQIMTNQ